MLPCCHLFRFRDFPALQSLGLVLALWLLLAGALRADGAYPVVVTDDRPAPVTFTRAPQTVAAISAFGADVMAALGQPVQALSTLNHRRPAYLGERVAAMVDLGEVHEPNLERLTELSPDLVIGLRQYTEPFERKFEEIGQFLAFDLMTYEDSDRAVVAVARALGDEARGQALNAAFADDVAELADAAPGGVSALLIWHWADTLYAFYDHHLSTTLMNRLQVTNAMGPTPTPEFKKPDAGVLTMEQLLRLNPDVILSFTGDDRPVSRHPVWQRLDAVRNNRVFRISDQYVMPHGPIARELVLREMAHLFYPERFAAPADLPAAARARPLTFVSR